MNQAKAGVILNYISILLNFMVMFCYTPYMLRMLGQSEFGLYSLAMSVISYLSLLDLGLGNAVVRYTSLYRAKNLFEKMKGMWGMFLIIYCVVGVVVIIVGFIVILNVEILFSASMTLEEQLKMKIILCLMIFNLAFTFPMSIFGSIMTAYEKFIFPRIISIIRIVLNPLVMVVLLFFGYKAITMVVVATIFNVLSLSLNYYYCRKKLNVRIAFDKINFTFLKEVTVYSFWIFLTVLMDKVYWSTGQFVLGIFEGTKSVSVFALTVQLIIYFTLFSVAISNVLLPKFTELVSNGNKNKEISDLFIKASMLQYYIVSLVLTGFVVFGRDFLFYWAGSDYIEAYYLIIILLIPMSFDVLLSAATKVLQARNQMKYRSIVCLISACLCFAIMFPATNYFGIYGCAILIALSLIIGPVFMLSFYYSKYQKLDMKLFYINLLKRSVVPCVMMGLFMQIRNLIDISSVTVLLNLIIVYSLLFITTSYLFSMNKYEKNQINYLFKVIRARF